jgi:hypothetical protein
VTLFEVVGCDTLACLREGLGHLEGLFLLQIAYFLRWIGLCSLVCPLTSCLVLDDVSTLELQYM